MQVKFFNCEVGIQHCKLGTVVRKIDDNSFTSIAAGEWGHITGFHQVRDNLVYFNVLFEGASLDDVPTVVSSRDLAIPGH